MRVQAGPRDSGHTLHREEGEISSQQQEGNACFQEGRFMDAIAAYSKAIDLIEAYASGATRRAGVARLADRQRALVRVGIALAERDAAAS